MHHQAEQGIDHNRKQKTFYQFLPGREACSASHAFTELAPGRAARLAAAAGPGEILVSADAASASDLDPSLERRSLELKGKELPTDVVSVRIAP